MRFLSWRKLVSVAWGVIPVGLVAVIVFSLIRVTIWDGRFSLQVNLASLQNRRIVRVSADPRWRREWNHYLRTESATPIDLDQDLKSVAWTEGQPFTVEVPCSGRDSAFGCNLSYGQSHYLLLRVEYEDGTCEYLGVEIPDGRLQRRVSVSASSDAIARKSDDR